MNRQHSVFSSSSRVMASLATPPAWLAPAVRHASTAARLPGSRTLGGPARRVELDHATGDCQNGSGQARRPAHSPRQQVRCLSGPYGYTQAKALVFSKHGMPSDVLDLHTYSISPPHSNLVTLRTLAAPLNPADFNQIQGTYARLPNLQDPATSTAYGVSTAEPSAVPGNEGCFEVLAVGGNVKDLKKGDWVIPRGTGFGTWRTHAQVAADRVLKVVDAGDVKSEAGNYTTTTGLTPRQVGTVSVNPLTAYCMLDQFIPRNPDGSTEGQWYIQNGGNSAVGRAAIQLGRKKWGLKGIALVRARVDSQENVDNAANEKLREELRSLGAERVVFSHECRTPEFVRSLGELTNGSLHLALNCVGGNAAWRMAKLLAPSATMVSYGAMSKGPFHVGTGHLIFHDLRIRGFWVSRWADENPDDKERVVRELLQMYADGSLQEGPAEDVPWSWDTKKDSLIEAAQGTLDGFRKGKGVFAFGET